MNPGKWGHSYNVAMAAEKNAIETKILNPDKAYVLGLLHNIGRRNGVSYI